MFANPSFYWKQLLSSFFIAVIRFFLLWGLNKFIDDKYYLKFNTVPISLYFQITEINLFNRVANIECLNEMNIVSHKL